MSDRKRRTAKEAGAAVVLGKGESSLGDAVALLTRALRVQVVAESREKRK